MVNNSGFVGPKVSISNVQLPPRSTKVANDGVQVNECGWTPGRLYLWTLQWEFHIIFTLKIILL